MTKTTQPHPEMTEYVQLLLKEICEESMNDSAAALQSIRATATKLRLKVLSYVLKKKTLVLVRQYITTIHYFCKLCSKPTYNRCITAWQTVCQVKILHVFDFFLILYMASLSILTNNYTQHVNFPTEGLINCHLTTTSTRGCCLIRNVSTGHNKLLS